LKKPNEPVVGEPGKVVFIEIEFQNGTKWPWKRGCFLGLNKSVDDASAQKCPLKVNEYYID
jgi:hypothetical protein